VFNLEDIKLSFIDVKNRVTKTLMPMFKDVQCSSGPDPA
jgi:hypothetical protein